MNLHRLFEMISPTWQVHRAFERAGLERRDGAFGDARYVGVDVVDEQPIDIEYVYNHETGSWSFHAALAGEALQEITSGRGEDDLLRHLKRKHRVKASQL